MAAKPSTNRFGALLAELNLEPFYPEKITLNDVIYYSIKSRDVNASAAAWNFLEQIIMVDSSARDQHCQKSIKTTSDEESDLLDEEIAGIIDQDEYAENDTVYPLDIVLVTFSCCDPFLKQSIVSKMVTCRLAVPWIYLNGEGDFQCSVWSMRKIISQHVSNKMFGTEESIVVQPNKIISFIRFGQISVSKSEIMNNILSENAHRTFFHRNCPLGTSNRTVYTETIEASWFLPSKLKESYFQENLMLLNLRGDALEANVQGKLLLNISNVIVVVMNASTLNQGNALVELFKTAHEKKCPIIVGLDSSSVDLKTAIKTVVGYRNSASMDASLLKLIFIKTREKHKSLSDVTTELRNSISSFTSGQSTGKSILDCASELQKSKVKIDEDSSNCQLGKSEAERVLKSMTDQLKKDVLPLQDVPWSKWSSLQKDYYRSSGAMDTEKKNKIKESMEKFRHNQLQMLLNLHTFVKETLHVIVHPSPENKMANHLDFFLNYLQLYLDEKSRKIIPIFSKKYQEKWQVWKKMVNAKDKPDVLEKMKKEVDEAEIELSHVSLGLEHVIREFSQMYESYRAMENSPGLPNDVNFIKQLPNVVANLIERGYSFELLDGDASNVPLVWVNSVFESLVNAIGDKKIFVLSVIGIQSSGKSTLLNCMFGLEFAVKAGRCTRGVFIRLVPVPEKAYPFDYILVIDSEGLRAPELALQKHDHDNELATFVIGLGDVTLINIKGENTSEVQDVLQIAVHAFMKLVLVNEKIKLKQSCMFVHQNVSAKDAKDKLAYATKKTVETLDNMTKEAAKQLNIADIQSFQEIIHFNSEKHVWYFPDLWLGDPPMAPTNPGYGKHVAGLRRAILSDAIARKSCLSLSDTKTRINDLWKGIMTEDFVFSFRNSLEMKAYNIMESQFQHLSAELKTYVFNFVQLNVKSKFASCDTEQNLNKASTKCISKLEANTMAEFEKLKQELRNFFEGSQYNDIVIKWRDTTLNKFDSLKEDYISDAKKDIKRKKEKNRLTLLNTTKVADDEIKINKRARQLAEKLKGNKPSPCELEHEFDKMWSSWIDRYTPSNQPEEEPLTFHIQRALFDRLKNVGTILQQELTNQQPFTATKIQRLEGSIISKQITERHLSISKKLFVVKKDTHENCVTTTLSITNAILATIDHKIENYVKQDDRFSPMYITEPLDILLQRFDDFNSSNVNFKLLPTYIVMIAVHVCRFAEQVYEQMNAGYEKRHGWKAKMEEYKGNVLEIFYNAVSDKTSEYTASSLIKNVIVAETSKHVEELMQNGIELFLESEFGTTKPALIAYILECLADENQFEPIYQYCLNASDFSSRKFSDIAEKILFNPRSSENSEYCKIAKSHISKIYKCIKTSIKAMKSNKLGDETAKWIEGFVKGFVSLLPISEAEFRNVISECPSIKGNVDDFSDLVRSQMETMVDEATRYFKDKNSSNITWRYGNPITKTFDQIWGCEEHCPFCREPCQYTKKGHVADRSHSCLQHKPAAILGTYSKLTNKLTLEGCTVNIMNKHLRFACSACHFECRKQGKCSATDNETYHDYYNYTNVIPSWFIPRDCTLECSDYWFWVIANFKKEINDRFTGNSLPNIPSSWNALTKEKAKKSLRK